MVISMPRHPSRIDLLELDIDVRLADLWREANDITEWNLEVVGAFMRAAYGKGYCDALTEDAPGSLCVEHGYPRPGQEGRRTGRVALREAALQAASRGRICPWLAKAIRRAS
jgi:hypothetical protein